MTVLEVALLSALAGCVEEKAAAPGDRDDDSAWKDDTGAPNPYTRFEGAERLDYGEARPAAADYDCALEWDLSGSPWERNCPGCTFTFDVTARLDEAASWDGGHCEDLGFVEDFEAAYAYRSDYYGYGPAWMVLYDGAFYAWGSARFEDGRFGWWYGERDWYGTSGGETGYFTFYQWGEAVVF